MQIAPKRELQATPVKHEINYQQVEWFARGLAFNIFDIKPEA